MAGPQQHQQQQHQLNNFNISSKTFKEFCLLPSLPLPLAKPWQAGVKCNSATLALQLFSLNVEQQEEGAGGRESKDECQVMHMLLFTLRVLQKKQTTPTSTDDGVGDAAAAAAAAMTAKISNPPQPLHSAHYPFATGCLWLLLIRTAGRQSMRRLRLSLSCSNVTANSRERHGDGEGGRQTSTRPRNEVIKHYGGGHRSNCAPVIACEWQM